ncbi:MAG TPA: helix-hairpin-helix domain-containing protein, partial [Chitinophagales bacterium]|nr:helix-hairpin-helix domain-containing protein [Chitinophagales bacterium]
MEHLQQLSLSSAQNGRFFSTCSIPVFPKKIFAAAILFALLLSHNLIFAQITEPGGEEEKKEDYLEQLIETNDNSVGDYEGIVDLEKNLRDKPINLNAASDEDLKPLHELGLLTDIQINSIITYREKIGNFISIYELQAVP